MWPRERHGTSEMGQTPLSTPAGAGSIQPRMSPACTRPSVCCGDRVRHPAVPAVAGSEPGVIGACGADEGRWLGPQTPGQHRVLRTPIVSAPPSQIISIFRQQQPSVKMNGASGGCQANPAPRWLPPWAQVQRLNLRVPQFPLLHNGKHGQVSRPPAWRGRVAPRG